MAHKFAEIAFTPGVKNEQELKGSRRGYARFEQGEANHDRLGEQEAAFIAARDSFYMATVSETGWPYIQHRGGPEGFVRVIDGKTIGFADFAGNRQYISVGNLRANDRVSMFFMDYANQTRLKLLGRVRLANSDDAALLEQLQVPGYRARAERGMIVSVEAFDWNCPQHITPRFTQSQVMSLVKPLKERLAELEAELAGQQAGSNRQVPV
jgi:predicted pyridoxine 5'-phosphate oxidase superfamily flavin-nucleotide-binding protein